MCIFCTYCQRRQNLREYILQPRRRHFRRLQRQFEARHPVPHLGNQYSPRSHPEGLHNQREPAERAQSGDPPHFRYGKPEGAHGDEAKVLLQVVTDYSFALDLLDDYDHQRVTVPATKSGTVKHLAYDEARRIADSLGRKFGTSSLFGREKDDSLKGALGAVMQTFDGREVYPGLEEKAANLLYFLIKDHPFVDGNKRIGTALFLWFLEKNNALYGPDGTKRISDSALVAMTLLIAESQPREKDILTRVLINLIGRKGP